MSAPLVLDADAVRAACSPADAVEAITAALTSGLDPAADLPRQAVPLVAGQLLLMPSGGSRSERTWGSRSRPWHLETPLAAFPASRRPTCSPVTLSNENAPNRYRAC